MTEIEIWTKWESQIVNGLFPLRRFLGRSNHSVVFLTEFRAQNLPKAAIKLVPADPAVDESQLARWQRVAALSHPHLIRILDSGRCKLGGHPFLFVVMEYAEQTLAQILPHRPLTPDEVRELLIPTLDALAYLHRKNLVQGQLKPVNFLVVNDQLKLASDTIRSAGDPAIVSAKPSVYDPPEAKNGAIEAAGDVWSLGITLVEALTQNPAAALGDSSDPLTGVVRRCLTPNPAGRPTIPDLQAQFSPASPAHASPAHASAVHASPAPPAPPVSRLPADMKVPGKPAPAASASKLRMLVPAIAVGVIVLVAIWAGIRPFRSHPNSLPPTSSTAQSSSQPSVASAAASQNPATPMSAAAAVLHQEVPALSHGTRNSIRGQIKVTVLVTVDRSGNVVGETLENQGSSKYFARLGLEAAKKWKFTPADSQDSRQWLLQFEFTRSGAAGQAVPRTPR
ncbi:MAG: eukaryotic-like serine/threonine-protein kinase [Gammaproteobacteria bacterium]|nr:eukaryotic-like serine/threonine-protein kinase [Gammaproteobacteria bacterium]